MVAEIYVGIFVDQHIVVVGGINLGDCDIQFTIVGYCEFIPYHIVLEFGQVGVTTVGHYLHDAAGALRGGGGAEGLVHTEGDSEDAVVAIVGQLGELNSRLVFLAIFAFLTLLRFLILGGLGSFCFAFVVALSLHIAVSKYQSTSE